MVYSGIAVSAGVAGAEVARVAPPPALPEDEPAVSDVESAFGTAAAALAAVGRELDERAARAPVDAGEVLLAQSMMVADPALLDRVRAALGEGHGIAHAIDRAFAAFADGLRAAGGYLAERGADLDDLRNRAIAEVLGLPMPGMPDPGRPFVLLAGDLAPADTATLPGDRVRGIVTELGGPTSHTAILAKSLGIPAVLACPGAREISAGSYVLVDGDAGEVTVDPSPEFVRNAESAAAQRQAALRWCRGPGRTSDGTAVSLLVNVGADRDLAAAAATDSEGVGLLRTEFLYLDSETEPGFEEQRRRCAEVFAAFENRKVVVRTLDAGADKPLPFVEHGAEPNPALGVRGLRLASRHPGVLERQLAAIAAAAADQDAEPWVMAPMVSTPEDARHFAARARAHGLPVAGAMIEVPAAALRAERILAECDFLSIGTNDLGQYTFAADRLTGELATLLDPWQPALLDLVAACGRAGAVTGKPVGVCGEAGGDPLLAPVLAGLGVRSLSTAPPAVAAVRRGLAAHSVAECESLAGTALAAPDAATAREWVSAAVS